MRKDKMKKYMLAWLMPSAKRSLPCEEKISALYKTSTTKEMETV